jgi:hypothetical protein
MNRLLTWAIVFGILYWVISLNLAHAQDNSFWNSYYAAQNGFNSGNLAQGSRRETEALINESRARRGAPPCSIGIIGQWQGRPAC